MKNENLLYYRSGRFFISRCDYSFDKLRNAVPLLSFEKIKRLCHTNLDEATIGWLLESVHNKGNAADKDVPF